MQAWVLLILENQGESSISFCPSELNPANLPSRGCSLSELFDRLSFWKQGPDLLKLDQSKWSQQPKPTGLGDQLTQPKDGEDVWGRDAQIYLAQIRAQKIEAEVEAAVMAARVSVSRDEPITERLLQYSSNPCSIKATTLG